MKRLSLLSILVLVSAFLIMSCGDGGGGGVAAVGGGGSGPVVNNEIPVNLGQPGPGDSGNYFPMDAGNFWHYRVTSTNPFWGNPPYEYTTTVLGSSTVGGNQYWNLRDSNPSGSGQPSTYSLVKDLNGLAMMKTDPTGYPFYAPMDPYWDFRFGLAAGEKFVQLDRTGVGLGMDLDGDGRNETMDIHSVVTNLGQETVAIPGGGNQTAAVYGREMSITRLSSRTGQGITNTYSDKVWFVSNVGPVKLESTITSKTTSSDKAWFGSNVDQVNLIGTGNTTTITKVLDAYRTSQGSYGIVPAAPVVIAVPAFGRITLTWPAVSGATTYDIYWSTTAGVTPATGTKITAAVPSFVHSGLTASTAYFYVVTAVNFAGESAPSVQVTATTTAAPVLPAAPTGLTAAVAATNIANTNQVTLSWTAASGATSYNIYWSTTTGVTPATGTKITGVITPFLHVGLPTTPAAYFYVVTAFNLDGEGPASTQATVATLDGAALYTTNCSGCHGALATSEKRGRTAAQIQTAINNNTGGMGSPSLLALTPAQAQAIANALFP